PHAHLALCRATHSRARPACSQPPLPRSPPPTRASRATAARIFFLDARLAPLYSVREGEARVTRNGSRNGSRKGSPCYGLACENLPALNARNESPPVRPARPRTGLRARASPRLLSPLRAERTPTHARIR